MSLQFSGLGSGLPINEWVDALVGIKKEQLDKTVKKQEGVTAQKDALSAVKTSYSALRTILEKFTDSKLGSTTDLFSQNKVTSSNDKLISATVTALASKQNFQLSVSQLATFSRAQTSLGEGETVSAPIDAETKFKDLASGTAKEGDFSIYVNNEKHTITVGPEDEVGHILDRIKIKTGLDAEIVDGKVKVSGQNGENIVIGATGDTSNFGSVMALQKGTDGSYLSTQAISRVNSKNALTGDSAGFSEKIQEGSFKIGDATFEIKSDTTLQSLINEINSNPKAGANASWDAVAGKMVLTSKQEGAFNINIENISGNFTDVMGLTDTTYNADGTVASSKLSNGSQTLGDVAKFKINGTEIISSSNTITSDISGIQGMTFNLHSVTEGTSTVSINVEPDTSALTNALGDFVFAFNEALSKSDKSTGEDGLLRGESSLTSIRNGLRKTATAHTGDDKLMASLASIGITTGKVGIAVSANTDQLVIDKDVMAKALAENPQKVKELLLGKGGTDDSGVLNQLKKQVDTALDPADGYFATREKSFSKEIENIGKSITSETEAMNIYKTQTENKFRSMDMMISKMKQQFANMNLGTK